MSRWLDHVTLCVQRHIHRHGHRMVQASGTLNQLFVSLTEARALLGTAVAHPTTAPAALGLPDPEALSDRIVGSLGALEGPDDGPLGRLRVRFRLTTGQIRLLMAAAAPLLSVDLSRLYSFAWADFAVKLPTAGFLAELVADDALGIRDGLAEFGPHAPLVRYRLLELRDSAAWGTPSPLLHRGVVVPDPVVAFLNGEEPSAVAAGRLTAVNEATPADRLFAPQEIVDDLRKMLASAIARGRPRPLLVGGSGAGRRTLLSTVAAERGWGVLTVDLGRLMEEPERLVERVAEAGREALLRDAVLLLRADRAVDDREKWDRVGPAIGALVDRHGGPVAFTASAPTAAISLYVSGIYDVYLRQPSTAEQRGLWTEALGQDVALATELSQRFSVSPGTVYASVHEARAHQAMLGQSGALGLELVGDAVRRRLDHALSEVAQPFATTLDWADVILPDEVMDTLNEIIAQAKYRELVYDRWGFRRKMSYGRGLACLFCGPPGTGKTMMAALIAKTLGRELYKVDLSRVVSKWVGETEKNLARVFDEAERAQVILLFDEADSLFSSRTEVKGSNDRFANMEINYLLQRMEQYDGMSLLTTNFEKAIDDAFKRRLKFKVDFPMPDAEQRAQLWQVMLPSALEVGDDIRFDVLGKKFKIAGGNIKNAVLRAAFYAAAEDKIIDHALLERAAVAESREMGRLI
ncbi:MAG: ATP-binding protein [bacterium]